MTNQMKKTVSQTPKLEELLTIDFTNLQKYLGFISSKQDTFDFAVQSQEQLVSIVQKDVQRCEKQISELDAQTKVAQKGLLMVNEIKDKVESWSDRVKNIEEKLFMLDRKIEDISYKDQLKLEEAQVILNKKMDQMFENFQQKIALLEENYAKNQETFKKEVQRDIIVKAGELEKHISASTNQAKVEFSQIIDEQVKKQAKTIKEDVLFMIKEQVKKLEEEEQHQLKDSIQKMNNIQSKFKEAVLQLFQKKRGLAIKPDELLKYTQQCIDQNNIQLTAQIMQQVSKIILYDNEVEEDSSARKQSTSRSPTKTQGSTFTDKVLSLKTERSENEEIKQQNWFSSQIQTQNQTPNTNSDQVQIKMQQLNINDQQSKGKNVNRQLSIQYTSLELLVKQIEQNQLKTQYQFDNLVDIIEKQNQDLKTKDERQTEVNESVQKMQEELNTYKNALFEIQKFTESLQENLLKTQQIELNFQTVTNQSKNDQQSGTFQIQQLTDFVKMSISNYQQFQQNTQKAIEKLEQNLMDRTQHCQALPQQVEELQKKSYDSRKMLEDFQQTLQKFQKENEYFMMERIPDLLKKQNNFRDQVQQDMNQMKAKLDEEILMNKLKWEEMNESYDTYKIKLNTFVNAVQKLQGFNKHQGKQSMDLMVDGLGPNNTEELKNVKAKVQRLEEVIAKVQKKVKKAFQEVEQANQNMIKIQPSLDMLSDLSIFQQQLNDLIKKQNEGNKLNKQDNRTIKEIYEYLDCKMDKADFNNKADKEELKKVQRLLNRRIEEVKTLLKSQSREGTAPLKPESSAFARTYQNMHECIACGNEYSQPPKDTVDFQVNSRLPKSRNQSFGPGFSRILSSLRLLESKPNELDLPEIYTSSIYQSRSPG